MNYITVLKAICVLAFVMDAVLGCLGVIVAYFFVKSLPLTVLLRLVICVVFVTSFMMFRDARRESVQA